MILFLSFCSGAGLQIRLWCELCSWPSFLSSFSSHQNPSQCYLKLPAFLQVQWCTLNPSLRRLRQELEFGASLGYVASHFRKANKPDNSNKTLLATSLASQSESHSRKKQAYLTLFLKLFSQLSFRDLKKSKMMNFSLNQIIYYLIQKHFGNMYLKRWCNIQPCSTTFISFSTSNLELLKQCQKIALFKNEIKKFFFFSLSETGSDCGMYRGSESNLRFCFSLSALLEAGSRCLSL